MVVTAYKDADSVLDAVNKGDVYRYVVKPWNADEMRITINNAIERFVLAREGDLYLNNAKASEDDVREFIRKQKIKGGEIEAIIAADASVQPVLSSPG